MKYRLYVWINPEQTVMRGAAIAVKKMITDRLGSELKSYRPLVREMLAEIEVDDSTELARVLDPDQYRPFFPSIDRVELEPLT